MIFYVYYSHVEIIRNKTGWPSCIVWLKNGEKNVYFDRAT